MIRTWRNSFEGIILLFLGVLLAGAAIYLLTRPDEYRAMARVKVHREVQFSGANDPIFSDPYFVPTEFEVIQSEKVLGKVLKKLDLPSKWGKKRSSSDRLEPNQALEMLRKRMDLRTISNTQLIEIRLMSDTPAEAATLANSIAESFRDFRLERNRAMKTEMEKPNFRVEVYDVQIVDSAVPPPRPIRPNRPLAGATGIFGSFVLILGIYLIAQNHSRSV